MVAYGKGTRYARLRGGGRQLICTEGGRGAAVRLPLVRTLMLAWNVTEKSDPITPVDDAYTERYPSPKIMRL
jgi:hypothetical protein